MSDVKMAVGNSARGQMRPHSSKSPPFLLVGLFVVIAILGFNYWNASTKYAFSRKQVIQISDKYQELNLKKQGIEKRNMDLLDELSKRKTAVMECLAKNSVDATSCENRIRREKDDVLAQLQAVKLDADNVKQKGIDCQDSLKQCQTDLDNTKEAAEHAKSEINAQCEKKVKKAVQDVDAQSLCASVKSTERVNILEIVKHRLGMASLRVLQQSGIDMAGVDMDQGKVLPSRQSPGTYQVVAGQQQLPLGQGQPPQVQLGQEQPPQLGRGQHISPGLQQQQPGQEEGQVGQQQPPSVGGQPLQQPQQPGQGTQQQPDDNQQQQKQLPELGSQQQPGDNQQQQQQLPGPGSQQQPGDNQQQQQPDHGQGNTQSSLRTADVDKAAEIGVGASTVTLSNVSVTQPEGRVNEGVMGRSHDRDANKSEISATTAVPLQRHSAQNAGSPIDPPPASNATGPQMPGLGSIAAPPGGVALDRSLPAALSSVGIATSNETRQVEQNVVSTPRPDNQIGKTPGTKIYTFRTYVDTPDTKVDDAPGTKKEHSNEDSLRRGKQEQHDDAVFKQIKDGAFQQVDPPHGRDKEEIDVGQLKPGGQ